MLRTLSLPLTLSIAIALAGCGNKTDSDTQVAPNGTSVTEISSETDNGVANTTVATPAMSEQQFINTVAASDAYEIQAGKLAQQKSATKAVKDFGKMMVDDHGKSTAKLKEVTAKLQLVPDATLSADQQKDLDALGKASATDFDTLYHDQQLAAHQTALAALEAYHQAGSVDALKDFANQTIGVVKSHLDHLNSM